MPQAEAEKCHPAGLDFPDFPEPLKREFLQLLQYTKNGEFPEFLDTVKRGFSSGDCATNGDTFSEREKLNFLQRKKGPERFLFSMWKRGVLRAFIPVEVLAVVPWDWRAYRAKGEPIRERLEALAVPDC